MEQYIQKSALVAEIEKLEKLYCYGKSDGMLIAKSVFDRIKNIIDTLEVIEIGVDVGSPEGDLGKKTVIDADGNISEVTFNKAQKGE